MRAGTRSYARPASTNKMPQWNVDIFNSFVFEKKAFFRRQRTKEHLMDSQPYVRLSIFSTVVLQPLSIGVPNALKGVFLIGGTEGTEHTIEYKDSHHGRSNKKNEIFQRVPDSVRTVVVVQRGDPQNNDSSPITVFNVQRSCFLSVVQRGDKMNK